MDLDSSTDGEAEARLLAEITAIAYRYAATHLKGEDAEDLAQDVVTECLVRMRTGTWEVRVSLETLVRSKIWTGAHDVARERMRRAGREVEFMRCIVGSIHVWMSPHSMLEHEELEGLRKRTLASLPHNCKRAYVMVREERERYQAVADRLGISRFTVCSHVVKAQRLFREQLEEEGIAAPPPPPGPGKRDAGAQQHDAELAHSNGDPHQMNGDPHQMNGDPHQSNAPVDSTHRSSDPALRSPAPTKRSRRRKRRRPAPLHRGPDAVFPLLAHVERSPEASGRRGAPTAPPTGSDAPRTRTDEPRPCTAGPMSCTGEPTTRTGRPTTCSDASRSA